MNKKITGFYLFLPLMLLFFSCATRISGSLQNNGQADLNISAAMEPRMTALIRSLSTASGAAQPADAPVLDGPALSASMSGAPGIALVSFKNKTPSAIEGPVKISKIGDFLAGGGATGFITFQQNNPSGGKCSVHIDLDTGPDILALISPDIVDYLTTLMAPIATGDVMTKPEYLELVTSVYRKGIADEISGAAIRASLDFPGPVQSVKGGSFSGRRVEFDIPLIDILVLDKPLHYEIVWR